MKWLKFSVDTTDDGLELVSAALDAAGVATVELVESHARAMEFLNQSALYWDFADADTVGADQPAVVAYLPDLPESRTTLEAARAAVERLKTLDLGMPLGTLTMRESVGDDEDWLNNWKKFYEPIEIGERLLVLPDWEAAPDTRRAVLRLDPGVAFGTGAHHTTRMCLELLESAVKRGDDMLDLGCGSGILAIAARLLGAERATAVDVDPLAVKVAGENARKNGLWDGVRLLTGDVLSDSALLEAIGGPYDLVTANIVADVIIRLAPCARALVREGGVFIASGIIEERRAETLEALTAAGFALLEQRLGGGWVAFLMEA